VTGVGGGGGGGGYAILYNFYVPKLSLQTLDGADLSSPRFVPPPRKPEIINN